MKLLIIGNGIAALSAAETFRKFDSETKILMLSEDAYHTYYRIKLSHFLGKTDFRDEELLVKTPQWYQDRNIQVKLNTRVERVDFTEKAVFTAQGERFGYDRLLLANGSKPFVPSIQGADKPGVFTLRSLDDLKNFRNYVGDKQRIVVIGGGLLGLEAAHGLVELGKHVTVLADSPYLLPRHLDRELSLVVQTQLESEGITFLLNAGCATIFGKAAVAGVSLAGGEQLAADAVLISAGVRPNTALFSGSVLRINRGVLVDDRMETNIPDVYAAGDIAEYEGVVSGLWTASNEQGKLAGSNLAGQDIRYASPQLTVTLNIGDVKLFSAGNVSNPDSVITLCEENIFHRLFVKESRIAGAALTGDLSLMLKAKNLVSKNTEVPTSSEESGLFKELMK